MSRKVYTLVSALLALTGLFFLACPPPASAVATVACTSGIGRPTATAELDLDAQRVDNPESTSTLQLDVVRTWPLAKDLFQDSGSAEYQEALNCLLPPDATYSPSNSVSVSLDGDYVRVVVINKSFIYDWNLDLASPWQVSSSHRTIHLAFRPDPGVVNFTWESITVAVAGLRLEAPIPLPVSEPGKGQYIWQSVNTRDKKTKAIVRDNILPSFTIIPDERLGLVFAAEGSESGQSIPFDVEQLVILLALASLLAVRKNRERQEVNAVRVCTRRLCLGVAGISAVQILTDILSWRLGAYGDYANVTDIATYLIMFALIGYWPTATSVRCVLGAILALNIATLLPSGESGLWHEIMHNNALLTLTAICLLGVSCIVVLRNINVFLPSEKWLFLHKGRPGRQVLRSWVISLAVLSIILTFAAGPYGIFDAISFAAALLRYLIPIGILLIIAQRCRAVSVLLESKDQLLLALAAGYVVLVSGPQWYVGYEFSIACFIAIIAVNVILRFAGKRSILSPFVSVLARKTPDNLRLDQKNLIRAERKVNRLSKDLKAFENVALAGKKLKRRRLLQKEMDRLHQWPVTVGDNSMAAIGLTPQRGVDEQVRSVRQEFPSSAGPADMALALGPTCAAEDNLKRSYLPGFVLAIVPACYFSVHEISGGIFHLGLINLVESFVASFWPNLLFWIFPPLALSVAWGSLAGRRGMGRGIQVWLFFLIPLGVHAVVNRWLDQSATLTVVFQCALLLIVLIVMGLWLDLTSIGQYQNISYFELFRGYVRFNRVIAAVTLLLPLVTAGLTIWNQIDNGVLSQKPPAQTPATAPPSHGP